MNLLSTQEQQIDSFRSEELFPNEEGPCVNVDRALHRIRVERQAYYSGTFVGNHVDKCLNMLCKIHFLGLKFDMCVLVTLGREHYDQYR